MRCNDRAFDITENKINMSRKLLVRSMIVAILDMMIDHSVYGLTIIYAGFKVCCGSFFYCPF